jgi:hypothetical protein
MRPSVRAAIRLAASSPGRSAASQSSRAAQAGVASAPSNITEPSRNSTNAIIDGVAASSTGIDGVAGRSTAGDRNGAYLAKTPKASAKASPWASHAARPNTAMPIQVSSE